MNTRHTFGACLLALAAGASAAGSPAPPLTARPPSPPAGTDAARPAATASNAFGIDLFRVLGAVTPDSNLFFSPYSMAVALAMTAEGARGETATQMARVLHVPPSAPGAASLAAVHGGHAALAARFRAAAGNSDPAVAARIAALRAKLDEANGAAKTLRDAQEWRESQAESEKAQAFADELASLVSTVDRFVLRIANALWVERSFALSPAFVQAIDRSYGGGVTPLDIAGAPEQARQKINDWVAAQTEQRIKGLIPDGGLPADARLVITNAVYFNGQWLTPFPEAATRDGIFTLADGTTAPAKLMHDSERGAVGYAAFSGDGAFFPTPGEVSVEPAGRPPTYPDDAGFALIALPYKGGDLSMVVIAPRSPGGLSALEARLTEATLDGWLKRLEQRSVHTTIPRFTMESTLEMSKALEALGMTRAFVNPALPDGAQFGGMTASADAAQQLYIGAVLHKAWVDVSEQGTEAAAATAVMMKPTSVAPPPKLVPFVPEFRADRPFLYLIRDAGSGVILFMGRMTRPTA